MSSIKRFKKIVELRRENAAAVADFSMAQTTWGKYGKREFSAEFPVTEIAGIAAAEKCRLMWVDYPCLCWIVPAFIKSIDDMRGIPFLRRTVARIELFDKSTYHYGWIERIDLASSWDGDASVIVANEVSDKLADEYYDVVGGLSIHRISSLRSENGEFIHLRDICKHKSSRAPRRKIK